MTRPVPPVVSSQQSVVSIELVVNGESRRMRSNATVADLIHDLGLRQDLVAVEINRELIRRPTFAERRLAEGDHVEVVEFVGGG